MWLTILYTVHLETVERVNFIFVCVAKKIIIIKDYTTGMLPIHKASLTISCFSHVSLTLLDIKTTVAANPLIKHSFKIIKRTGLRLFFIFNKYQAVVLFPDAFYFSRNLPEHDPPRHRNMGICQKASKDRFWEDSLIQRCPVETEHKLKLYM